MSKERYAKSLRVITAAQPILAKLFKAHPLKKKPVIRPNHRLSTTAGRAIFSRNLIELNTDMFYDNMERLEQTVAHEYAHLMAYGMCEKRGRGHGPYWRHCMKSLGYEPIQRHDMMPSKMHNRVKAYCGCRDLTLTKNQVIRMKYGTKYQCLRCKTDIELVL